MEPTNKELYSLISKYKAAIVHDGWIELSKIIVDFHENLLSRHYIQTIWQEYFSYSSKNNDRFFICIKDSANKFYHDYQKKTNSSNSNKIKIPIKFAISIRNYAHKIKPVRIKLQDIEEVERISTMFDQTRRYVYRVVFLDKDTIETPLTNEMQIRIEITYNLHRKQFINGVVLGQEEDISSALYVGLEERIAIDKSNIYNLFAEKKHLYLQLADVIEKIERTPDLFKMINVDDNNFDSDSRTGSSDEIPHLIFDKKESQWTKLIWGPPGTGKSYSIAEAVNQYLLIKPDATILLVAPTNQAVDALTSQIIRKKNLLGLSKQFKERKILRYGFPKLLEVLEDKGINGPVTYDSNIQKIKDLVKTIQEFMITGKPEQEIAEKRARLFDLQSDHRSEIESHAKLANIVLTTTTQTYLKQSPLLDRNWDMVVIDEASMVSTALCFYLSSKAAEHLLIVGDPYQLGPVFDELTESYDQIESESIEPSKLLGKNIYEYFEMVDNQINTEDNTISRRSNVYSLNSQFRCVPEIWKSVSNLYTKMTDNTKNQNDISNREPFAGNIVTILDTSNVKGFFNETQFHNKSRFNDYSAGLTMKMAMDFYLYNSSFAKERNIVSSIITPYRAQVKRLRSYINDESCTNEFAKHIKIGTIHSFQGDESHIVYVDLVESNRKGKKLGKIIINDEGRSLINVASTRAKAKLVIVLNCDYLLSSNIEELNPLLYQIISNNERIMVTDSALFTDASDTKWESKFKSEYERQWHDRLILTHNYPIPIQHYSIKDPQTGYCLTKPDFAFPELKIAVYCDGRSIHFYNREIWNGDHYKRNKLTSDGWIVLIYTNDQISKDCRSCVEELFSNLEKRIKIFGINYPVPENKNNGPYTFNQGDLF